MIKMWVIILIILAIVVLVFTTANYLSYRQYVNWSRERLLSGSQIIQTNSGPIEYVSVGDGSPVLIVHGAGGGYDQGLMMSQRFLDGDFRVIAISRFGYLRTPLPADASPIAQADAYVALLDALNIRRVVVVAFSNGGPSALQFALRHPDRCSALAMLEAISHRAPAPSWIAERTFGVIFQSDFVFWLMTKFFKTNLVSLLGVPPEVQAKQNPEEKKWLSAFLQTMHPISLRRAGMFSDGSYTTSTSLNQYPLERILVPTLVIHAVDDSLIPFTHGQNTAKKIPGARMITLQSGGHLVMGRQEEVRSALTEFIR